MKAAVIGLGQFGFAAARALAHSGVETIGIDIDPVVVDLIKDEVALAVCTDATLRTNLEAQGVGDVDLLVAGIGSNFEAQILLIVLARQLGVERIIARAASEVHARVLRAIGTSEVIFPEKEAAQSAILRALLPGRGISVSLGGGLRVLEVPAPDGLAGRTLGEQAADIAAAQAVTLFALRRAAPGEEAVALLSSEERIQKGDTLLMAGSETDLARVVGRMGLEA